MRERFCQVVRRRCVLAARIALCSASFSRMKAIVTGDIGCYTLGALAPLSAMDTCVEHGCVYFHEPRL